MKAQEAEIDAATRAQMEALGYMEEEAPAETPEEKAKREAEEKK